MKTSPTPGFSEAFEDALLARIVAKPELFIRYAHTLNADHFTGDERIATVKNILAFWRNNGSFPDWTALSQTLCDSRPRQSEAEEQNSLLKYLDRLREHDTSNAQDIAGKVIEFSNQRALYLSISAMTNTFKHVPCHREEATTH